MQSHSEDCQCTWDAVSEVASPAADSKGGTV